MSEEEDKHGQEQDSHGESDGEDDDDGYGIGGKYTGGEVDDDENYQNNKKQSTQNIMTGSLRGKHAQNSSDTSDDGGVLSADEQLDGNAIRREWDRVETM